MRLVGTIAVIASDQGLLRSLVFALEVEGFRVMAARGWNDSLSRAQDLACLVIDAEIYRREAGLRSALDGSGVPAVFLSDGPLPQPLAASGAGERELENLYELKKPFQGGDLIELVSRLATGKPVRT